MCLYLCVRVSNNRVSKEKRNYDIYNKHLS